MKTKIYLFSAFLILGACIIFTSSCKKDDPVEAETGTVTDADGNVYKTVKIGTQTWMAENLKTTKYRNGDAIPEVTEDDEWMYLFTGAYCNCYNDVNNVTLYGRLYNWYAVTDSRNIAPAGWHVPSEEEWKILSDFLGGEDIAGGKLKSTGNTEDGNGLWFSPNTGASDEFGFKALPGSCRDSELGKFLGFLGDVGYWWASTSYSNGQAYSRRTVFHSSVLEKKIMYKQSGFSLRCVKD
ncbi:MAG: fibrobacter succinogenes major paralogous domain-containing protein [Bacteroidales bacterium]|nr:fibrobacter succinogenes major paralogous domain-containing protein [Bacteroidales bacterium]